MRLSGNWLVKASQREIWAALTGSSYCHWWPEACQEMRRVSDGPANSGSSAYQIATNGWLSRPLLWRLELLEVAPGRRVAMRASRDLVGHMDWTLEKDSPWTVVNFDGEIAVQGSGMLTHLGIVIEPFIQSHINWVMQRGEIGLRTEISLRNSASSRLSPLVPR